MKIGVFDSGIGGKAIADELQRLIEGAEVIIVDDRAHVPYGGRSKDAIIQLTDTAIQPLLQDSCDCIVIACNTATTNAIVELRARYPAQNFVGLEPMIKPAVELSRTKKFAVLATPSTLQSEQYAQLKSDWAKGCTILEPDCSTWASLIEHDKADQIPLQKTLAPLLTAGIDVIVLGCTHYHWIKPAIEAIVGDGVTVLEPSQAIKNRIVSITA
ncbi:MAG: glutamate racemase [Candidatus Microsaccharimonas sp.]